MGSYSIFYLLITFFNKMLRWFSLDPNFNWTKTKGCFAILNVYYICFFCGLVEILGYSYLWFYYVSGVVTLLFHAIVLLWVLYLILFSVYYYWKLVDLMWSKFIHSKEECVNANLLFCIREIVRCHGWQRKIHLHIARRNESCCGLHQAWRQSQHLTLG